MQLIKYLTQEIQAVMLVFDLMKKEKHDLDEDELIINIKNIKNILILMKMLVNE